MPFPPSIRFVLPPPFFLLFSLSASFSACRNKAGRAGFAAALLVPDLNFRRISNILVPPAPRPPPTKHREYGPLCLCLCLCVYLFLALHVCGADSLMPKRAGSPIQCLLTNLFCPFLPSSRTFPRKTRKDKSGAVQGWRRQKGYMCTFFFPSFFPLFSFIRFYFYFHLGNYII